MLYALTNDQGDLVRYPYTLTDLKLNNPQISWPQQISDELAAQYNCYPVTPAAEPDYDHTLNYRRVAVKEGDAWVEHWESNPASSEEITERTNSASASIRAERTAKLTSSDWTQFPDTPMERTVRDAWAVYRQALRDITDQPGYPHQVDWPVEPEAATTTVGPNYWAFYDSLLVSPAYGVIRERAVASSIAMAACVEFMVACGDAKSGRANPAVVQVAINNLVEASQFTQPERDLLQDALAVGGLDQMYTLPPLSAN